MGCDFYVKMFVGVRWSEIVEDRSEPMSVTKYDPDTGKPYKVSDTLRSQWIDGKQVGDANDCIQKVLQGDPVEMHEIDEGQIIGIQLENQDIKYQSTLGSYSIAQLQVQIDIVKQGLEKLGCKAEPKVHFISYCQA